jgi:hypothetical protein
LGCGVIRDLLPRRGRVPQDQIDKVVDAMLGGVETQPAFHAADLVWTMADGGEPEQPPKQRSRAASKGRK